MVDMQMDFGFVLHLPDRFCQPGLVWVFRSLFFWCVISIYTLELETIRLQILDVKGFPIKRHGYIMQCKGKRPSPATEEFKTFVLEQVKEFIRLP